MKKKKILLIASGIMLGLVAVALLLLLSNSPVNPISNFGKNVVFDSVGFSSQIESGALGSVSKIADNQFSLTLVHSPLGAWHEAMLDFMIKGYEGKEVTFVIQKVTGVGEFEKAGKQMVYTCDGKNWKRMIDGVYNPSTSTFTFKHTFECNVAEIATYYPHKLSELDAIMAKYKTNNNFKAYSIGKSIEGRDIYIIEVTNFKAAESQKTGVCMVSRQHPAETGGSLLIEGMINYLLEPANADLLNKYHYIMVPMSNPDGIADGHTRTNSQEAGCTGTNNFCDMNRMWTSNSNPDVNLIRTKFNAIEVQYGCDFFMDLHSLAGGEDQSQIMGGGLNGNAFVTALKAKSNWGKSNGIYPSVSDGSCPTGGTAKGYGCTVAPASYTFELGFRSNLLTKEIQIDHGKYIVQSIAEVYK